MNALVVLVVGGTGTVGSHTLRHLVQRGASTRVMSRSAEKFGSLPRGVTGVVGDLEKPETLQEAFRGAERLFLITPVSQTETQQGLTAVEAAKAAGVRRIVYLSVAIPEGSTHIPHFKSKIPIEKAIQDSGLEWTILRPNNFFQNDYWFQEAITKDGIYPQPIGSKGLHRVDVRDIADAAVNALTRPGHEGKTYPLHGPDALTGEDVAAAYTRNLEREVRYVGDDLDAWAAQALTMRPEWLVQDLRVMYQFFQEHGFLAGPEDFAEQRKAVEHEPRSFDAFVAETTQAWKGRSATHA